MFGCTNGEVDVLATCTAAVDVHVVVSTSISSGTARIISAMLVQPKATFTTLETLQVRISEHQSYSF